MNTPPFIQSLHRPFNQALKTSKWVCLFIANREIRSSEINFQFHIYLIDFLYNHINDDEILLLKGIPSRAAIRSVYSIFEDKTVLEREELLLNALKKEDRTPIEKQLYSTYKAASYYVNMAKDKLGLINQHNTLSNSGKELLAFRSSPFKYSEKEKYFFCKRLIDSDFLLIISLSLFKKLCYKHSVEDADLLHYDFLSKYYNIKHFNFTRLSLQNFNTVRNYWITSLDFVDKNLSIKNKYIKYINSESNHMDWFTDLLNNFENYKHNEFKNAIRLRKNIKLFESHYQILSSNSNSNLGFVNLYDLKEVMNLSVERFQYFLNSYFESEKSNKKIFFNNIVNSIDRRKRFSVRNTPVLYIKIK